MGWWQAQVPVLFEGEGRKLLFIGKHWSQPLLCDASMIMYIQTMVLTGASGQLNGRR